MAKRNMKLKSSIKKVTLEKKMLQQRVAFMENEVASLLEERMITTRLKEELARQKEETLSFSRRKMIYSLVQTNPSRFLNCLYHQRRIPHSREGFLFNHIFLISIFPFLWKNRTYPYNVQDKESNCKWTMQWMPNEKMDDAKVEKSTYPRVSIFNILKGKVFTKDQAKGLKISHATQMKKERRKEGRKVFYKHNNG